MSDPTCHCCEGPGSPTPVAVSNRPGLSAIAYRVGTFAEFRRAMLDAIAATPDIRALGTRSSDDHAITTLELWAAIGDVLSFYQERTANEAFLRTATLRDSVLRMARLIGYRLGPGSAATAMLAFTVETGVTLDIPVGLRVQSVPAEGERPQKFETLEAITARAWLNRLTPYPAPVGANPLARGRTWAYLAPGREGLAAAAELAEDDRLLVFAPGGTVAPEALVVRGVESEGEHLRLAWTRPVQGTGWVLDTPVRKTLRSFRLFGFSVPPSYPTATEDGGILRWQLQDIGTGTPGTDNYALAGGSTLHLDARHEDLEPGTELLLHEDGGQQRVLTVTAVGQAQQQLGLTADVVTRLTVTPDFDPIADRRKVVLHELVGPPVRFWGYAYPDRITSPVVHLPARRIDGATAAVLREVDAGELTDGETVSVSEVERDRPVLLSAGLEAPIATAIRSAEVVSPYPGFDATPLDPSSLAALGLDAASARRLAGLVSAPLAPFPALVGPAPALAITIGESPARELSLSAVPANLAAAAAALEGAIRAADTEPAFTDARVMALDGRLLVLAGVADVAVSFDIVADDETTAVALGLTPEHGHAVHALRSATLAGVPAFAVSPAELSARIGPTGPLTLSLPTTATTLATLASQLQGGLRALDPAPAFAHARVVALADGLLVLPGPLGAATRHYVRLTLSHAGALDRPRAGAALLGNVASASHGETVADEVLGDGDPTAPFQRFSLRKGPVTFVPTAAAGGAESSLEVTVGAMRWQEVDSLFGRGADEAVFVTRIDDDGVMSVAFGDGVTGARLPAGRGNVVATYRQGTGVEGRVGAESLRTALDRPKGLKSVLNPATADGGADPETMDDARDNAPGTVRTFGRAVSLRDLEDLVRESGEVAKASATWVWNGAQRAAHLTIAGQAGATFSAEALARIHASLNAARDPNRLLLVDNYTRVPIAVTATLTVDGAYVAREVADAARAALLDALSFQRLRFGEPVHLSDVFAALHAVAGVLGVDVDRLGFAQPADMDAADFEDFLDARGVTRAADGSVVPVQGHLRIEPARPNPLAQPPVLAAEQAHVASPTHDVILATSGGLPG